MNNNSQTVRIDYYSLTLNKDEGISGTSGAIAYAVKGTKRTIDATVADGYVWSDWTGTKTLTAKQNTITLDKTYTLTAHAVKAARYELSLQPVTPNAAYRVGTDVVTSFKLVNSGDDGAKPEDNISVIFKVYNGSTQIYTTTVTNAVVPAKENNLLYFKWKVPTSVNSIRITGEISENTGASYGLTSRTYETTAYTISTTPDTEYTQTVPSGYTYAKVTAAQPAAAEGMATWSVWTYQNGAYQKVNYGIGIGNTNAVVTPHSTANATQSGGVWTMKSGYGVTLSVANTTRTISGYTAPDASAYSSAQYAIARFPEFYYSAEQNKYKTLELVGGAYQFRKDAEYDERIHFTPVWFWDNSVYTVSVTQSDMWTPAGMISRTVNGNGIKIQGSIFDDWNIS